MQNPDHYDEADTWHQADTEAVYVKKLLVTPRRVDRCNFLCNCQRNTSQTAAAAAAAELVSAPQLC